MIIKSDVTTTSKVLLLTLLLALSPAGFAGEGTILVFGDSISAAYGMDQQQGWAHLLSEKLDQEGLDYQVVNASVSGETTGGGVVRLPKTLEIHHPDIVVLELGGNDGLRGYPIDSIKENLARMTKMSLDAGARVLLVGMVLPPNYGRRYTRAFEAIFAELASAFDIEFLPKLLEGTSTDQQLLQRDGIHPTPEAQKLILEEIWPKLSCELRASSEESRVTRCEKKP